MNMLTIALLGLLADDAQNAATNGSNEAATRPPATSGQATADSVVAAAFTKAIDTAKPELKASPTAPTATVVAPVEFTNLAAPALAILGLAGLAFALTRRRRTLPSSIRIVESASLGPKRSIVIAEVLGERMVLAVSEAGVSVLATKQLAAPELAPEPSFPDVDVQPVSHAVPEMGFFERLMGRRGGAGRPKFEEVLGESIEDQELRAKLAAGLRGTVP